ncbi:hypothetical protein M758_3G224200 [Ceratodon purpureus]|uniref:Uncharacterized protein n=1 Tax=Ceratodon purpureus TaxID=3225 RepID=A0A8T0IP48_CERPU|nr:hypothetical protein KC19_3G222800 [Ceratodon purpureus]KAG0624099.1 hypothetical protein M758_3G224200 [Ceratodon purpureus]
MDHFPMYIFGRSIVRPPVHFNCTFQELLRKQPPPLHSVSVCDLKLLR